MEHWTEAPLEAVRLRRLAAEGFFFTMIGSICVIPLCVLGILHVKQTDSCFYGRLGILIAAFRIGIYLISSLLMVYLLVTRQKYYMRLKQGWILKSTETVVTQTGFEASGRSSSYYYIVTYYDPLTGQQKEYKASDVSDEKKLRKAGDHVCVIGCLRNQEFTVIDSYADGASSYRISMDFFRVPCIVLTFFLLMHVIGLLHFGSAALWMRLWEVISGTLLMLSECGYGIDHRQRRCFLMGVMLCGVLLFLKAPVGLYHTMSDLIHGPQQTYDIVELRHSAKSHFYYACFTDLEGKAVAVEISQPAFSYYQQLGEKDFMVGEITYYPNSKILVKIEP